MQALCMLIIWDTWVADLHQRNYFSVPNNPQTTVSL